MADAREELCLKCLNIIKFLEQEEHGKTAYDYINDAEDVYYIFSQSGDFKGARILLGSGLQIDTEYRRVIGNGRWGSHRVEMAYCVDNLGLDEALKKMADTKEECII